MCVGLYEDGSISLWLCIELPDDRDIDPLKSEFGIPYYDIDELESVGEEDGRVLRTEDLIRRLSYSKSFADEAIERANKMAIPHARLVIALYNFAYDPDKVGIELPEDPRFLGVFEWNDDE